MTDNWIGGDFTGLLHMGSTLSGAVEELEGVVKPLSSGADGLVGAAGWQGEASESFRAAWTEDATTAGGLADLIGAVGKTLTDLGTTLSTLNDALYNASQTAAQNGIKVGADGSPPASIVVNNPPTAADTKATTALTEYVQVYKAIKLRAQQARVNAATALQGYYGDIDPEKGLKPADDFAIGIFLRDLYASRDDRKSALAEAADKKVDAARAAKQDANKALANERAALAEQGKGVSTDLSKYKDYRSAVSDYVKSEQALADIEDSRNAFSKLVNFKTGDIEALSKVLSKFKMAPDFLKDIPVVDVAAALAGAGFEAKEDHDEGWSWAHAALVDGGAAVGGVMAGIAVAAALPEAATAAGATLVAGIAVGSALVIGVGVDKIVHEHWSEDIHDHGVLGGLGYGSWDVTKKTGAAIADDAKGVWHGITSIF